MTNSDTLPVNEDCPSANRTDETKGYPESASGYLIDDLGKFLNMNPSFYRRRIRCVRPAAITAGLIGLCILISFLIPDDSNQVFQIVVGALLGFFLGLATPVYEHFCVWAKRVNRTMEDAEGTISIWEAMYQNSILQDKAILAFPNGRISATWAQRMWIKIKFPTLVRKWHKYFRCGMAEPTLEPLPYSLIYLLPQREQRKLSVRRRQWRNERVCKKRLHYMESLSRCIFIFEPTQSNLDYLLDYSNRIIGETIRQNRVIKDYLPTKSGLYVHVRK